MRHRKFFVARRGNDIVQNGLALFLKEHSYFHLDEVHFGNLITVPSTGNNWHFQLYFWGKNYTIQTVVCTHMSGPWTGKIFISIVY